MSDTGSTFTHLEGALSGENYPADELIGLDPVDGRPLLARYDIEKAARTLTEESLAERRTGGLWQRGRRLNDSLDQGERQPDHQGQIFSHRAPSLFRRSPSG